MKYYMVEFCLVRLLCELIFFAENWYSPVGAIIAGARDIVYAWLVTKIAVDCAKGGRD